MEAEKLESGSLTERLSFAGIDGVTKATLAALQPQLEVLVGTGLDRFYSVVRATPALRSFFESDTQMERAQRSQLLHWRQIASGQFDQTYENAVYKIGQTHARIGLEPKWIIGGYSLILEHLLRGVIQGDGTQGAGFLRRKVSGDDLATKVTALSKVVLLDIEMTLSVYFDVLETDMRRRLGEENDLALDTLADSLLALAQGELSVSVDASEYAQNQNLASSFNLAVERLREIIVEVRSSTTTIRSGSSEIAQASDDLARRTEQQAASLEQATASISELTHKVSETSQLAQQTDKTVLAALEEAKAGGVVVQDTKTAMSKIEDSSKHMGEIIGVIDEIAFQTNLLALNAGVEAARAGDAGKGFAVVASEVRSLAQRSAEAANTIKALISSSAEHVETGVALVENTSKVLSRVIEAFGEVNGQVSSMAKTAETQASSISEINSTVSHFDQVNQHNAAMVEQTSAAGASLALEAEKLSKVVERFRINA